MSAKNHRGRRVGTCKAVERLPLDIARDTFTWLVTGPQPLAVDGRRFPGLPRRSVPLDELRDRLLQRNCPRRTRDAVWAYLVRRSRGEGSTWTVACVGMALPGLAASARWLATRYRGERADVHAAVLAGFVEALATVDLHRPGVITRIRWAADRAGKACLKESLDAPTPVAPGFRSAPPNNPWGHPDLVLARAVADGVLTEIEAELIGTTRLEDVSVAAWARARGIVVQTAQVARFRAEHRLVTYLTDQARDSNPDDPVVPAVLSSAARPVSNPDSVNTQGLSLAVSGRRRNGRPIRTEKLSPAVKRTGPKSGLLECGDTTPAPHTRPIRSSLEVPQCA